MTDAKFIAEMAMRSEDLEEGRKLVKFFSHMTTQDITQNAVIFGVSENLLERFRRLASIGLLEMNLHDVATAIDKI